MWADADSFRKVLAELGLLDGLDESASEERAELVTWLLEQGFGLEQIRAEVAPMLMPAHRELGDDARYVSERDVSATHGIDLALLQGIERALGLPRPDDPDGALLLQADADAALRLQQLIEVGLDPGQVLLMIRRLSDGISRAVPAFRYSTISAIMRPGMTELEVAKAHEEMVRAVIPLLGPMIRDILFVQLRRVLEGEEVNARERAAGVALPGARQLAVAFADMVEFTQLGEAIPPEELVGLVERLAELAREVVNPPVRLVKTIGDAVMLVSSDAVKLLDTTLTLLETAAADETLPKLRIGIASGWAVSRARDWFGSPVNVASRVTNVAEPGTILLEGEARAAIGDAPGYAWSFVGARALKGVEGETELFRVRRPESR
ncbi:pH-sensitive adenylate cyclase [Mycolicibacter terrae]|uniref:PH-sensitive adenylate cyclase n=1 Tax=Mycolicibacter terrae TaxID=1788 RepID=A0AAD1I1U4_9MYCO|nr:adenylate/guanylate cyclase domain-containing protein [Mycolicibacter terrae]ORW91977.1 cyclase [Mycolicibacter terrae]BBX24651.1 pH-sensitive adenylate cyclase [Mycolicibacter terrae]SNV96110.1 chain A, Myco adenylyl cyclase, holoenzyme, inhibited state [Mycolicibacter terrae]